MIAPLLSKSLTSSHVLFTQISNLVGGLSKKNFRQTSQELALLSTQYGYAATLSVLKSLLGKIDLKSTRDQPKMQLLLQALDLLSTRANFVSLVCQAFDDMEPLPHDFLHKLSKALKLTAQQDLLLGIALIHSHRPISKAEGLKFLKSKLTELPTILKEKLTEPVLHELLQALHNPNFDSKLRDASIKYLQLLYKSLSEPMPHMLSLLIEDDTALDYRQTTRGVDTSESNAVLKQIVASLGPASVMQDLGYTCCQDESALKVLLRQFGKGIDEAKVARILGMFAATHSGLEDGISLSLYDAAVVPTTNASATGTGSGSTVSKPVTWNLDVFIAAISSMCPRLDWLNVMHHLDFPEFCVNDQQGFDLLSTAYTKATNGLPFPTHILLSKWRNLNAQLNLIQFATLANASSSTPAATASISKFEGLDTLISEAPSPLCVSLANVGIVNALLAISEESGFYAPVSQFLEKGRCFILLLALVESKSNSVLREELIIQLTSQLLLSDASETPLKTVLIQRIWELNQLAIVDTMISLYNRSADNLACIWECAQQLNPEAILSLVPYTLFAMDLCVLASQAGSLDLNSWMKSMITEHSDVFVRSILRYIASTIEETANSSITATNVSTDSHESSSSKSQTLSSETMKVLLGSIKANDALLSDEAREEMTQIRPTAPRPASTQPDVEVEADRYFQQVYEERITPAQFMDTLSALKAADQPRSQQIFACMVNNLFSEYSFFGTYPDKELEITGIIFGGLIKRGLLEGDLLSAALRAVYAALQQSGDPKLFAFGINTLVNITAQKLVAWPKYAASLLEIPHFAGSCPAQLLLQLRLIAGPLVEVPAPQVNTSSSVPPLPQNPKPLPSPVPTKQLPLPGGGKGTANPARGGGNRGGGNQGNSSNQQSGGGGSSGGSSGSGGGSSSGGGASGSAGGSGGAPPPGGSGGSGGGDDGGREVPLGSLNSREVEQPDEDTRDRIHFILNNVSANNMTSKANELRTILKPQFFDYFATHLIVHRVSNDTRFQNLYLELIDQQGQPELFQKVLKVTFRAVQTILNSPKLTQSAERSNLKNLGTWLGSMTLARNHPIMFVDLAVKELILKAYEAGNLWAVLPFVSRILLQSVDSKVFRVPNPWLVAILRLLKEIHSHPRVHQNIKFEVELLYQGIQEDLATMPPSDLLLNHTMYTGPNMKDFSADPTGGASNPAAAHPLHAPHIPGSINWMPSLSINPELTVFTHQPVLKQRLLTAFNKSIDELVPDADNTVAVVPKTTLRLILKDFANEPDETKVLQAARSMAQSLASSLLHATLRNHIRTATHNTMKASLEVKAQYDTIQPQFHRAIDENLDTACTVLAKHFVEKTLERVEHELRPALEARVLHRDQLNRGLTTRPFSDQAQVHQLQLPEMLKVRPGIGATPAQVSLYDGFLRLPALIASALDTNASGQSAAAHHAAAAAAATANSVAASSSQAQAAGSQTPLDGKSAVPGSQAGIQTQPKELLDSKKALEKLDSIIAELERWGAAAETTLEAAADWGAIQRYLPALTMTVLRETQDRAMVATQCATRVFDLLYTNPGSARGPEPNAMREMYTRILFALARATPAVVEAISKRYLQVNSGELNALHQQQQGGSATPLWEPYHKELTHALLSWQLLRSDLLDPSLSVEIPRSQAAFDFAFWLVKSTILGALDASGNAQQPQMGTPNLLAGSDLPRCLAELENILSRSHNAVQQTMLIQSCAQVTLDVNTQNRRAATHTDQLHQQAKRPTGTATNPSQRQAQLVHRQQMLAKTLPQPVVALFSEWVNLWQHGTPTPETTQPVLIALRNLGLCSFGEASLAESEGHFLRGIIDAAVLAYLMQSQMQAQAQASLLPGAEPTPEQATYLAIQPYAAIDALAKLVVWLVKNYPEQARIHLLQRVLHQTSSAVAADYASNVAEFNQRPYFRLLSSLLVHLSEPSFGDKLESLFLSAFADLLLDLRPQQCAGFAFAWLELVSHRLFMPKLIRHPRACFALQKLLIYHLTFMEPYLAASKLNEAVFSLYQGTLRVFLVLIHDFPEFLCDFHHSFCDVLPPTCIQLRNLILSAFPRNVKLPDPALNIKMEQIPASKEAPRVFNIEHAIQEAGLGERLDAVLKGTADPAPFYAALPSLLFHKDAQGKATTYNIKLINSIVLFVGINAIADPHNKIPMEMFMSLASSLDAEGRYHLFNAFANQLRYPSSHTHYFSWALLYIFSESQTDAVPEQITRVLLERYIAQKPTPWGLAITYQELTKNPSYNFWSRDFVKASPDIGRLFMNLSRRGSSR